MQRQLAWYNQFLPGSDFIGILQLVPVGFENSLILAGITVELFGYLR
jgi:hypothetical protein